MNIHVAYSQFGITLVHIALVEVLRITFVDIEVIVDMRAAGLTVLFARESHYAASCVYY